ncbi:hypothetical protein VCHENC02_1289A, partial [Vibrio harveyi]
MNFFVSFIKVIIFPS